MNRTDIEYLDYTWNVTHGCTAVDGGCTHCWAKPYAKRLAAMGVPGYSVDNPFRVICRPDRLDEPLEVKKPARIGVSFMGDLFHEGVPFAFIGQVWDTMFDTGATDFGVQHEYMILTKRPQIMKNFIHVMEKSCRESAYRNIWLGVSVHDQASADERIPILLQTPAAHRFVSFEPALGAVDFKRFLPLLVKTVDGPKEYNTSRMLDLIICGGESGPGARPMHPDIPRSTRDQCAAANVPFNFKQWGEWLPNAQEYGCYQPEADYNRVHQMMGDVAMCRVGKKAAGRLLDGVVHDGA